MGIGSFGSLLGPALFFNGSSTTAGDWLKAPWFLTGIATIGSERNMDTNVGQSVLMYFNGNSNGSANHAGWQYGGDSGLHLINLSTNGSQSGTFLFWDVTSSSNGQPASVISGGSVAVGDGWVPTNRLAGQLPGWSIKVGNVTSPVTNHMRGFAVASPNVGPDTDNYSFWMADFINKVFRVPEWTVGKLQPQDGGWVDSFLVDPTLGRVGVGVASLTGVPAVDSKFQVVNGAGGGLRIGYLEGSENYIDGNVTRFRNGAASVNMLNLDSDNGAMLVYLPIISTNLVGTTANPLMRIGTNAVNGLTVSSNGNVGINTNAPVDGLTVQGSASFGNGRAVTISSAGAIQAPATGIQFFNANYSVDAGGGLRVQTASGDTMVFRNVSTEWAKFSTAGLYGLGTGNPLAHFHESNIAANVSARLDQKYTNSIIQGYVGTTPILQWSLETNGPASYSAQATNQLVATGYTNTTGVNMQAIVTATAVSFTVNDRSGTVLYTSPTLTATLNIGLQPGWSVRGASGLAGTVIPGL